MPIQAHVLFRAADGYGSSGTPTPTDVGADPYPPVEVCAVLTRKNCFLFSQEGAFFLAIGGAVLYNLYYVELCAEKELSMEKLLVFIPAYNCEKQVTRVLSQLLDQRIAPWVGECIVVNNRSADGTEAAVQDWMARQPDAPVRLLRNDQNYGLGGSHKVAFGYAAAHGYEHLVVLHGDDQGAIADLLPILNDGTYKKYDCCLGSRFMKGSKTGGDSALRTWGNYGFNWLFSLVARKKITDLGSGLNLYAVEPLKNEYYK